MEFGVPSTAGYAFFINESEKMRIDSNGNLLVGDTSSSFPTNVRAFKVFESSIAISHNTSNTSGDSYVRFGYSTNTIGSITQNGTTAVLYNTSSDQRLKSSIVDAPSASDDIDAIQVRSFDWKADGSHQKYGMVAQELQTVAPEAVSAPEDPDEMMGVDYSKLVPMLVKEIQSLRARVQQLENN
jgi:Zn-dependent M28 family amino/carboxypeptidase